MPSHTALNLLSGTAFGIALTASGVWTPAAVLDTMHLRDFHMLKVFLAATGTSALIMHTINLTTSKRIPARSPTPLGPLGTYSGNIIGGALLGAGMALTGACPGTVLVQAATGTYPGRFSLAGAITGGFLYRPLTRLFRGQSSKNASTNTPQSPQRLTLYERWGVDERVAVLAFEALCIAVLALVGWIAPSKAASAGNGFLHPVVGGVGIGAAQLVSLVLRGTPVGISAAYEQAGAWVWRLLSWATGGRPDGSSKSSKELVVERRLARPGTSAVAFSGGVMLGAWALAQCVPSISRIAGSKSSVPMISPLRAFLGGVVVVLGARAAGGCTSGHGISGMSLLSTASVVAVASMFAGGMGLAVFIA